MDKTTSLPRFTAVLGLLLGLGFLLPGARADFLPTVNGMHDPSRMVYDPIGNRWLIFYTGNGIPYAVSTNQSTWSHANSNRVFPSSGAGSDNTDYWAADMWPTPLHGNYYLFYSLSSPGSQVSSILVASTPTLTPMVWTKVGTAISSVATCSGFDPTCNGDPPAAADYNTIDPCPFYDPVQDRLWLTYGSFWDGIYIVELNPSNPTQQLSAPVWLAGGRPALPYNSALYPNEIEGSFVYFHAGYFYLSASINVCCAGNRSTYQLIMGRSTDITGPYVDKDGVDLRYYGGSIFDSGGGYEIGPGQFGIASVNGNDYYTYHIESYDFSTIRGETSSQLAGRSINYDPATGWPLAAFPATVAQGVYTMQIVATSLYLDVRNQSTNPAVEGHIEQDLQAPRLDQYWRFYPTTVAGGTDTYYNIQNVGTGLWLTIGYDTAECALKGITVGCVDGDNRYSDPQTGTDFVREDYALNLTTNENQKWRVILDPDGSYCLQSYRSGLVVGLSAPSSATPGVAVMQMPFVAPNQTSWEVKLTPVVPRSHS